MNAVADKETDTVTNSRTLNAARARDTAARVVWIICMALALVLAIAAFTFALGFGSLVFIFRTRSFKEIIARGREEREAENRAAKGAEAA